MWMESNFWHHSGSWGTWVKLTHKTPHVQTLGPKTQNTGWQESLPHTPARGQGESSRGLDQIIYCSRGKSEKTGFNRCSGSSGRIQPQGSFLPHPHPKKKSHKTRLATKAQLQDISGKILLQSNGSPELDFLYLFPSTLANPHPIQMFKLLSSFSY